MITSHSAFGRSIHWVMALLVVLLQGCLTIEENYVFKKDGSGSMEYVFDASEMGAMMEKLPGDKNEKDGTGQNDLSARIGVLRSITGISKVKFKKEQGGWLQRVSLRFADVNALNAALNELDGDSSTTAHPYFRWEGNTLVRTTGHETGDMDVSMGGSGDSTNAILKQMYYKFDMRFADELGDVQVAKGMTKEADGTKRVKLGTDWAAIKDDPGALDMRITLKK